MEDVFSFVKESLSKANNKISSHQNLELYSSIYSLVGGRKPASSVFSDYGYNAKLSITRDQASRSGVQAAEQASIFIYEREPCMK
mmetsp:Transcript_41900/g.48482  ORF Transcript_41900/g.48482 Transcript_41900/m.48482 type:complete len:85 (-) Transcript_41900:546-800(-)